jgi:hypothetical protein
MIGLYTPVLILQAYCLYHAYQHNAVQHWYWLIIFLPGIGCALYLYHNFYNRDNIQSITEGVKTVVNSNYKLEQLEKAYKLSDNITSKTNLANGYVKYGRYDDAIKLYEECLSGFMADDPTLQMLLLQAYFLKEDYESAVSVGKNLQAEKSFQNAEERIAFAWALHRSGKTELAEATFMDMNKSFSNYKHRVEFGKFLLTTGKKEALRDVLASLQEEFELMKSADRRFNSDIIREARELASRSSLA